jgi:hypothetical protein
MVNLALWLKANNFKLDQVQTFMPTPMATTMYHRQEPLRKVSAGFRGRRYAEIRAPAPSAQGAAALPRPGGLAADPRGLQGDGPGRPDRRPPQHLVPGTSR